MKDISIITINYNGFDVTCELIESLVSLQFEGEIIVVDNGSFEDETIKLRARYSFLKTIRSEINLGFAGGNNLGIKEASCSYLFFLNNDTTLTEPIWLPLIDRLNSSPNIGMVCPKILFEYAPDTIQFAGYTQLHPITLRNRMIGFNEKDCNQYQVAHEIPYAMGAAMMTSRTIVERVGLMPDCYFLYYEELDWSLRFRDSGYKIWYEPAGRIYHKESASTGRLSPLKQYYLTRNRLFFVKRNLKGKAALLAVFYQIFISLTKNSLKAIIDRRFDLFKATLKGIMHGMKMLLSYGN